MDDAIIRTTALTKRYGEITAVNQLNLEIKQGEVFGLLGPNGAGKTTTTLMLLGLTEPTVGTAMIDGYDCTLLQLRQRGGDPDEIYRRYFEKAGEPHDHADDQTKSGALHSVLRKTRIGKKA